MNVLRLYSPAILLMVAAVIVGAGVSVGDLLNGLGLAVFGLSVLIHIRELGRHNH